MRMLTSEARIDAHRFRSGYLSEKDYGRLSHALGTLAEARVFIDDTASIGVLEMRAKARRLKAEHGLHLLIIDYIQLMQGRGRFESRQAELASISRSLKGLAKELQRPDRRAVAAVARAGNALRSSAAALRPARVRRARAGRRRRHVHLPRGAVSRRGRQSESGGARARPRSSSASSATVRSARRSSRSSRSTRGSRTSRMEHREAPAARAVSPADRRPRRSRRHPVELPRHLELSRRLLTRARTRDHRRRQGQRLRARRRRGRRARSSRPARRCSRAPTSRKASCCAGRRARADPRLRRARASAISTASFSTT